VNKISGHPNGSSLRLMLVRVAAENTQ
jgi:hypothetical protein